MAKLEEMYNKEPGDPDRLSKGWILCNPEGDESKRKKIPVLQCLTCNKKGECQSLRKFEDAIDIIEGMISNQTNPDEYKEDLDTLKSILMKMPDEEATGNDKGEDEGKEDNKTEEKEEEEPKKKKKSSKKKTKKKSKKKSKKKKKDDNTEKEEGNNEEEKEELNKTSVDFKTQQYLILPCIKNRGEAEKNIVSEDDVEDLMEKFNEEGVEFELYKLEPITKKRSKGADYVIWPVEVGEPIFSPKDSLMEAIKELDKNEVDFRIFELGRELAPKKTIELEYVEEEN